MAKELSSEFPSDWHRDAFVEGCVRELAGCRRRKAELEAIGQSEKDGAFAEAVAAEKAVLAELRRLGHGQAAASKRPAARAKKG